MGKKLRILIAEDDTVSGLLIEKILSPYGECDIAANGNEAIRCFTLAHKKEVPYDLICLDIMMPELDGQRALRKIREIEKSSGLKDNEGVDIVMVTALNDAKNAMKAFKNHGAIGYITKPITKETLLGEIRTLGLI